MVRSREIIKARRCQKHSEAIDRNCTGCKSGHQRRLVHFSSLSLFLSLCLILSLSRIVALCQSIFPLCLRPSRSIAERPRMAEHRSILSDSCIFNKQDRVKQLAEWSTRSHWKGVLFFHLTMVNTQRQPNGDIGKELFFAVNSAVTQEACDGHTVCSCVLFLCISDV